ncbi:MAG: hypothetical protein M3Q76_08025, partial [Acidobacteriota bacterium]|nr:hypothetical protein [Acidobacteriota bacterium]
MAGAVLLYNAFSRGQGGNVKPLAYNLLFEKVQNGQIDKMKIGPSEVVTVEKGGQQYTTAIDSELRDDL